MRHRRLKGYCDAVIIIVGQRIHIHINIQFIADEWLASQVSHENDGKIKTNIILLNVSCNIVVNIIRT